MVLSRCHSRDTLIANHRIVDLEMDGILDIIYPNPPHFIFIDEETEIQGSQITLQGYTDTRTRIQVCWFLEWYSLIMPQWAGHLKSV